MRIMPSSPFLLLFLPGALAFDVSIRAEDAEST